MRRLLFYHHVRGWVWVWVGGVGVGVDAGVGVWMGVGERVCVLPVACIRT